MKSRLVQNEITANEDTKLRVGILGCGPIAQYAHLEASQKARNAVLHCVCDEAYDLAQKMGDFYGASKTYTGYDEMLADNELDAVIIATADEFHLPTSIQAIKAGKHVLVEKPVGTDLDQALQLEELVKGSKLVFQVGHMKRFDPGIAFARSFIQQELGDMIAFKGWYCDSTHRYAMTDSTQPIAATSQLSRKPTVDPKADPTEYFMLAHGSHLLDTARYLAGEITSVKARLVEKKGIYSWFIDTGFANGCNGHLDLTVAVRMDWHEGFHIYGELGSVLGKIYNPWYFKTSEVQCFAERDGNYHQLLDNKAHFFQLQLEAFADTVLNGSPQIGTDIDQGIESLRAMIAIARSVETSDRVTLKEVTGKL